MRKGIALVSHSEAAVIVLHEIYGVNRHMVEACEKYHGFGYDVFCPNVLGISRSFSHDQQATAYSCFNKRGGFAASGGIDALAKGIRERYRHVFLIGFSVGAALAWICSENCLYDGAVCHYGSRIRDYRHIAPACPVLLLFARRETSFSPDSLLAALSTAPNVDGALPDAKHGFCNIDCPDYDAGARERADELTRAFFRAVAGVSKSP